MNHSNCFKYRKYMFSFIVFLSLILVVSCAQKREVRKRPYLKFVDLTLSRKIDDTGVLAKAIDATTIYSTADKEVVALIQLENLSGKHNVRWDWYSPDGKLYYSTGNAVAKTSEKNFIRDVTIWHRLSVAGEKAAVLTGKWEIHIFLDDERVDMQSFHIMEPKYVIHLPENVKTEFRYNRWALIISIENYANLPEVIYAKKDMIAVKDYLGRVLGVPDGNIVTILNQEATNEQLESYLTQYFPPNIQKDSTLYVYFIGHGLPGITDNIPYLMLYNANPKSVEKTGYSLKKFYDELSNLKNRMSYVFLDTTFCGYASKSTEWLLQNIDSNKIEPQYIDFESNKIISVQAAKNSQPNRAYHAMQHGLFTYYFLRGFRGEADANTDNKVSVKELYNFIRHNVSNGSRQMGFDQIPVILPDLKKLKDQTFSISIMPEK